MMLTIKIFNFDTVLHLNKKKVNVVEIHQIGLFRKVIEAIKAQTLNEEPTEKIWIYNEAFKEINRSDIEIVFDFFDVFSNIRIVNPVAKMIHEHLDEVKQEAIQKANFQLNQLATDLLYDLDIEIDYKKSYSVAELLSVLKIKIVEEASILDNLFLLVDYLSIFKPNCVLFIINAKSYLLNEELKEFYNYILVKQVNLILLEGRASDQMIKNEQKLIIDEEYDDYYEESFK